ncbi:MAG: hypothetical protein WA790_12475 [Sulfitobacter sp.]
MRIPFSAPLTITATLIALGGATMMATAAVDITESGNKRCIASDGCLTTPRVLSQTATIHIASRHKMFLSA